MPPSLLGLDIGTTNAKAVLLSAEGKILAAARERYGISFPKPGWAEQAPETWWRAVCWLTRQLKRIAPRAFAKIRAIGVSGQGCPLVAVSREGKALRPAILWLDTRAREEAAWMESEVADLLLRTNGNRAGAYNLEPKALWLRRHEPQSFDRAHKFLTTVGYINLSLTGEFVLNHSDGGILFAYDRERRNWSRELLAKLGIPFDKYPRLAECREVIGQVTARAARESGLASGTPVVAGGEDTSAAALAAGATEPGDAYLSMGTAAVLGVVVEENLNEPRLLSFPHVLQGRTLFAGSMSSGGAALDWYAKNWNAPGALRKKNPRPFVALDREAASSPPGSGGLLFLPYLSGELHPILDAQARGVFFGLSLEHRRGDIVRSLMEGTAFAIRHNLAVAEGAGARVREIFATGGPTRSAVWCRIISDVTGRPLIVSDAGAPEGDALLAGWGEGLVDDPCAVVRNYLRRGRRVTPRREFAGTYAKLFDIYQELYVRLKDQFQALSKVRESRGARAASTHAS